MKVESVQDKKDELIYQGTMLFGYLQKFGAVLFEKFFFPH